MDKIVKKLRNKILDFQDAIMSLPEDKVFFNDTDNCPVVNSFADGMHIREITIPKGIFAIGKIHLHEHVSFLLKGEMIIVDEESGRKIVKAPQTIISKPGIKRAVYAISDCVFTNVFSNPTNEKDITKLEEQNVVNTYEEYNLQSAEIKKLKI
jgi:quercetin dioxygenase-like cupin family protein|tara:strand:- start:718 stop:1176 length:459 start_codon:yes stop_codon:yes gene_type:complete